MKKFKILAVLFAVFCIGGRAFAADGKISGFQASALNFIIGYGVGSFIQGDTKTGETGLIWDIANTGVTVFGGIIMYGTILTASSYDTHSAVDYSRGIAASSFLLFASGVSSLVSRIYQAIKPYVYKPENVKVIIAPTLDYNCNPAFALSVRFKL